MRGLFKLICFGFVIAAGGFTTNAAARTPAIGQTAPPFVLRLADNRKISLQDLRGKVVVINF
jgi:cytochrome oxidase Cu insertion factor (SCO1/SenC/PrrC family)